jgi:hypothetical protein
MKFRRMIDAIHAVVSDFFLKIRHLADKGVYE